MIKKQCCLTKTPFIIIAKAARVVMVHKFEAGIIIFPINQVSMNPNQIVKILEGSWESTDGTKFFFAAVEEEWNILEVTPPNQRAQDNHFRVYSNGGRNYIQFKRGSTGETMDFEIETISYSRVTLRRGNNLSQLKRK